MSILIKILLNILAVFGIVRKIPEKRKVILTSMPADELQSELPAHNFEFFRDPKKFAYFVKKPTECSVCSKVGIWLDASGYSGVNKINCICFSCMDAGKLIDLEIEPNIYCGDGNDAYTITYKTPRLPTWQDPYWPTVNGKFPVFERVASKLDFADRQEFLATFIGENQEAKDIEWLWDRLPTNEVKSYNEAPAEAPDIAVYLFTLEGKKYWVWDSN